MPEDQELLAAARRLEEGALADIHDRYYDRLFRYIVYRVNDRALAEDLTGDVFVQLLTTLQKGGGPRESLKGWLYRVASNRIAEHYRSAGQASTVEIDDTILAGERGDMLGKVITREALRAALQTLTPDQQNVIALRFGWQLSIREVAQTMGKTEGAIKQLQTRALAAIARKEAQGTT